MKPVLFVRNDRYESFGIAAEAIAWEGLDIFTRNVAAGAPLPPVEGVAGVVMFGGTMNVDQTDRHPFLSRVREYTREAVDEGVPFLGICLGAQILARALGREVVKSPVKEVGFEPLRPLPEAKEDPLLSFYVDGDMVVQWHEDTFELPDHAELLASSDRVAVQAFRAGERAWGIQFHQEVDASEFGWWLELASNEVDLELEWGKSAQTLRQEAGEHMHEHEGRGRELFRRFAGVVREAQG
jgi:GMP synthase-like glutamine amidotransferase